MRLIFALLCLLYRLSKYGITAELAKQELDPDIEFEISDTNRDGKVDRFEFQQIKGQESETETHDEVFGCLDIDMNGFVTKEERDSLKIRFYKSRLSQLSAPEVLKWISHDKCVPTQIHDYLPAFRNANLNGLALWDVAVRSPGRLRTELRIDSPTTRHTIVHAICREIEGLGCLGPPAAPERVRLGDDSGHRQPPLGSDADTDGRVTAEEFAGSPLPPERSAREAFACLDPDENGQARPPGAAVAAAHAAAGSPSTTPPSPPSSSSCTARSHYACKYPLGP